MLVEAGGVIRGAGLVHIGVEEVRRGWVMVRLGHHVGIGARELLLAVGAKQRGVELRFAGCRREDGEVGVAKGRRKEIRLLLWLRLRRREAARTRSAERVCVGFDLAGKVRCQVERGDGGGVRTAGLRERLWRRLLVAQVAGGVRVISREVGLVRGELRDC